MVTASSEGTAALDKALDVLDAVGASPQGLAQAELAAQLNLPRTTLYRLLATLVARGLLRRDPLRRVYCLGFRCFEYARAAYAMPDLVAAAGVELRALRDLIGETTYLAVRDGFDVLTVERCDGAHSVRSSSALGQRKPLHCTSQGKAILSALPPAERDALVKEMSLLAVTPRSITDRRRLLAEIRLTATRGYSIDDEEIVPGVRCIGAPIVDGEDKVRGAISVAGPAFRLTRERLDLLGPEVAAAARRIGQQFDATRVRASSGEATAVAGERAFHGAYPRWSARSARLIWADTLAPAVHQSDGERDTVRATLAAPIEALLLHAGGVLVAQPEGWWLLDAEGHRRRVKALPRRRFSALAVHPGGALWACLADGERWKVGMLAADGTLGGGGSLNEAATALAWDAEGETLHAAAADSGTIYALKPASRTVRRLATVPRGSGRVSGVAVDRAGGVWCALADGWSVVRFAPDGSHDRVIALPVPSPTDLAFGGAASDTLYVTSARAALSLESLGAAPLSGQLFAIRTEFAGHAEAEVDWPLS